jgi:hypothetical protein
MFDHGANNRRSRSTSRRAAPSRPWLGGWLALSVAAIDRHDSVPAAFLATRGLQPARRECLLVHQATSAAASGHPEAVCRQMAHKALSSPRYHHQSRHSATPRAVDLWACAQAIRKPSRIRDCYGVSRTHCRNNETGPDRTVDSYGCAGPP